LPVELRPYFVGWRKLTFYLEETMTDVNAPAPEILDVDSPVDVADKARDPTPYEKKLRTEARQHRLRAAEAERQRDEAIAAARKESEQLVAGAQSAADARVVRAELKAYALKAGIVDLDGLKLLDLTGVKLKDDGEVDGAEALIANLRTAKPWLFGAASSSSSAKPPAEQSPKSKKATEMTLEEWKAARKEIMQRR
jgi:hypothetical protein